MPPTGSPTNLNRNILPGGKVDYGHYYWAKLIGSEHAFKKKPFKK